MEGITDSIFYSFSNLDTLTYKLKFAPSNLWAVNLGANLIDNYLDTTYDIALDENTEVSFAVDGTSGSMENRFTLVFLRSEESGKTIIMDQL